jgi:DNA-directed RNA polymerase subunit RPC12/RpoP
MQNVKRYFVRKPGTDDFRGTFTLDEIRSQIRAGVVASDWEAIVGMCQTFRELKRSTSWVRLGVLLGGSSSPPPPRDVPKPPPRQDDTTPAASFACVACGVSVRLPLREAHYRCPKCKSKYNVVRVSTAPLAFLLIPERVASSRASQAPDGKRNISPQVRAAFALFGLEEAVTLERIRQAYREAVSLYHPDKVSHLGAELKQLAEEKTKRFNSAFRVLEDFYDT